MGQSRTTVAGALGPGRSRRAAYACARPDRDLADHAHVASRADQASGRAHKPLIHVKGYAAPETKAAAERAHRLIEQAEALGRAPKTRCCCFQSSMAFGSRTTAFQWRRVCASLRAQFLRSPRSKRRRSSAHDWASYMGMSLMLTGDIVEGSGALRSGDRAVRSCDIVSGDAFGQDSRGDLVLSLVVLGSWLSRGRARGCRARAQRMRARSAKPPH